MNMNIGMGIFTIFMSMISIGGVEATGSMGLMEDEAAGGGLSATAGFSTPHQFIPTLILIFRPLSWRLLSPYRQDHLPFGITAAIREGIILMYPNASGIGIGLPRL
jgi:hypothetical protein